MKLLPIGSTMALPYLSGRSTKREQLISIDLGGRTTKAVHLARRGEGFSLLGFAVVDAPIFEKTLSTELLAEHVRTVCQQFEPKGRMLSLSIGVNDSIVRHADLPAMPVNDMRNVLKNNSKNYLQQDLPGYVFDCFIVPPRGAAKTAEKPKAPVGTPKVRVLVAGARKQLVEDMQSAVKTAGFTAEQIVPGLLGPVNAFEASAPEIFSREVVALVDIGFRSTSIAVLFEGELVLSRVVAIGGDKITTGLAESLGISYAEAEGIKVGMPAEVQASLDPLVVPLGRELRASLDFFEHQYDRPVSQVLVSGAAARSDLMLQMLQAELLVECKPWNPVNFLHMSLPPQQTADIENVASQLAVAIGSGIAAF